MVTSVRVYAPPPIDDFEDWPPRFGIGIQIYASPENFDARVLSCIMMKMQPWFAGMDTQRGYMVGGLEIQTKPDGTLQWHGNIRAYSLREHLEPLLLPFGELDSERWQAAIKDWLLS